MLLQRHACICICELIIYSITRWEQDTETSIRNLEPVGEVIKHGLPISLFYKYSCLYYYYASNIYIHIDVKYKTETCFTNLHL